jgi:membrane glycosyltransferase
MPIHNEDTERVFASLKGLYLSLHATGKLNHFQLFVLSDTTDPNIAAQEERHWRELRTWLNAHDRLHYRRRTANTGRKAGNIMDFCQQWGKHFDHMIVLDADSIMHGQTILQLVRIMQANPRAGIIQTVPLPVNQETVFARILQFSCRLCSELLTTGQSFWQLGAGNYFGHNAIIRIQPFVEHCQLPILPGSGPLAGEILSHDFVEAALMRRAGWAVWNLPEGRGSYEEMPSNILDYAKRDRRWCQGNLQHLRLLTAKGLHPLSRLHFLLGVMAFVSSPLWLLLTSLGLLQLIDQASTELNYFPPGYHLFPLWPVIKTTEAISLFAVTIGMLLTPKLLALLLAMRNAKRRAAFGGGVNLLCSTLLEIIFAALLAPVMMVFHSLFVISILSGYSIGWNAQPRGNRGLTIIESVIYHTWQMALGFAAWALVAAVVPDHIWWIAPVILGLLLSVPLAVVSSRADIGHVLMRCRLMSTPEEIRPSQELRQFRAAVGYPAIAPQPDSALAAAVDEDALVPAASVNRSLAESS